jgi:hypothetical protein
MTPDGVLAISVTKEGGGAAWLFHATADDVRAVLDWSRPIDAPVRLETAPPKSASPFSDLQAAVGRLLFCGTSRGDLRCTVCTTTVRGVTTISIYHPDGVITAHLDAHEMNMAASPRTRAERRPD